MNKKSGRYKLLSLLLIAASLAACTNNAATQTTAGSQPNATAKASAVTAPGSESKKAGTVTSDMVSYSKEDENTDWKDANPNYIELNGTSAGLKGTGAALSGNQIMIMSAGVYVISGKLDDGQIIVDTQNDGMVRLVLNGAEINSKDNAPIYVKNADKTIVTLQEGTQNAVSDGVSYASAGSEEDKPNAAIFSKDDLTINGAGSLTVHGNYNNGIMSKDDLKITGGHIQIHAVDDGLVGRDMVAVKEGAVVIEASGDGIRSTNDTETSKGFIAFEGGTFDIQSGADGIQAASSVLITGGIFNITTGGGSANANVKTGDNRQDPRSGAQNNPTAATAAAETQSAKGIKAATDITISGGAFDIDSSDDAVHSNNSINIAGDDISIASGDDGIHADASILINGGVINITKSYEGIESKLITLAGGETHVISSDDGINVGGGSDGSSVNGRPGQNSFSSSGGNQLRITGGYVSVDSLGDGLDSNGSISMTGGTVLVSGPTANNNGPLDYDAGFEMTGGFLIAAGSSGMAEAPSEQSPQHSVLMSFSQVQQAGTLVSLKDGNGKTVAVFAPEKPYQSVVISSPELKKDASYTLYSGGTSTGTVTDGLYKDGVYEGGTEIVSFTIANSVTYLSEAGVTTGRQQGNPGGGRGPGFGGK